MEKVLETFRAGGLEVLEGDRVVDRQGARGALRSVYVRDPDLVSFCFSSLLGRCEMD